MKNVFITGGSRGIGAALVKAFRGAGSNVAFCYKNSEEKALALSEKTGALPLRADVSCAADVHTAISSACDRFGSIDVLINNAGIAQQLLFTDITDENWQSMIDTCLLGTFLFSRAVTPMMVSKKRGAIINISSMWGITGASCEVHYSAAKAGIIGLTKALAKELGPSNVRVNCIAPGFIDTDMNGLLTEETRRDIIEQIPLMRAGKPEDIAAAALFLASDDASFITGQVLSVDGGIII